MAVFTTNWYLHKTHFKKTSTESQTQNFRILTEFYGFKRATAFRLLRDIEDKL